jgi:RNA polymerase sigma-70 factor (ECF subfamily)
MEHNCIEDTNQIVLAAQGNREAFNYLANKYQDSLLLYIGKIIPNREDALDICQESFQKCFNNISAYNNRYAFSTWLYTIAQNTALDFLRKKRIPSASSIAEENAQIDTLSSVVPSPEEEMIYGQAVENLLKAIKSMPEIYRRVAELRFIHDYPLEEIAKELDLPLNTVKTRVTRSKQQLNKIWKS